MCRARCICKDDECSIRAGARSLTGDPAEVCQTPACNVCMVFKKQPEDLYTKSLQSKNARLDQLLRCCPAISELYQLAKQTGRALATAEVSRHKKDVQNLLRKLVACGENKLNCLKNIGEMAEIVPRILDVQLMSGYSEFWTEIRKVAKALNKQPNLRCKLAALIAIRKHITPGSPWSRYLETDSYRREEREILDGWTSTAERTATSAT